MNTYIELPKECPKCHKKTLFFCIFVTKSTDNVFEAKLGVRCHNSSCDFQGELKQVDLDEELKK